MTKGWTESDIANLPDHVQAEYQVGEDKVGRMDDTWTQTEVDFAAEYLEPRLEAGTIIAWWPQVKFRLPFMTYTADFAALTPVGNLFIYEIKGAYRLPSAGRSNTAVRALSHFIGLRETGRVFVIRATKVNGDWKFEEIEDKREAGPHTRAKVNDE